jgi:hypothetical protein
VTPSALDVSDLGGAASALYRAEAIEKGSVLVALAPHTDNAERVAPFPLDLPYGAASNSEVAPLDEASVDRAALLAEEVAPSLEAPEPIDGSQFDPVVDAKAMTPPFEGVEVSAGPDAEWVTADAPDTAPEEQSTEAWSQGAWESPSLEEIRPDLPEAIEPDQPFVQATAQGVVEDVETSQVESAEQTGAVHVISRGPSEEALSVDAPLEESWTAASLLMREEDGEDELDGEVAEGGEEMEATPFDHLTGDRLSVLVERGPESLDALVVASEAQARAVDVLDGLARRLRSGDLAVAPGSGTSAESVLASILAALLSERP